MTTLDPIEKHKGKSSPLQVHSFAQRDEEPVREEVPEWVEDLVVRMKKMETEIHTLRKEKAKGIRV